MKITLLSRKLAEVAPIDGVSESGVIWFQDAATDEQRAAAQEILDNWVDPPEPDWAGFRADIYQDDAWKRVLNSNAAVGATLVTTLWQFQNDSTLAAEVKFLWDSLIPGLDPPLSVDEVTALNLITIDNIS